MNDVATPCNGPSYKGDDIVEMFRQAPVRCGKPATVATKWGWRCTECAAQLQRSAEDPNTILGILLKPKR
jgi:hypothetical protein